MLYFLLQLGILRQNEKTHKIFILFGWFPDQLLTGRSKDTSEYQ